MKLLHNILRGSTLATALFIFQACYGMPQNLDRGALYEATIKVTDSKGKPNHIILLTISVKKLMLATTSLSGWSLLPSSYTH